MSGGQCKKVSDQEIDKVHNYIEQCIQKYMTKKEAVNALFTQANIEPTLTKLVWERLERENQKFFKAYYTRLVVKDQIKEFNRLLSQQVELKNYTDFTRLTNGRSCNECLASSRQQIPITNTNIFGNIGVSIGSCPQRVFDKKVVSSPSSGIESNAMNPDDFLLDLDSYFMGFAEQSLTPEPVANMGDDNIGPPKAEQSSDSSDPSSAASQFLGGR